MPTDAGQPPSTQGRFANRWWCEVEVILLIAFVGIAYGGRLTALPLRGEEPRWCQVAYEMQLRGDWIVPREQGDVFPSRPPLHSWLIAASTTLCGTRDAWAVRLPSVVATLLTTLLIYAYGRTFLSRLGALSAALAFASFGELFQTGRQAETEPVFTLLVSASLLLWHWGWTRGWPATLTWTTGYGLMALAVLTKGPQPPVYFLGTVILFLALTGRVRCLNSAGHLLGLCAGLGVIAAWAIPCYVTVGWHDLRAIVIHDSTSRFEDWSMAEFGTHLIVFPLEVIACTLPWSLLLLASVIPPAFARLWGRGEGAEGGISFSFRFVWGWGSETAAERNETKRNETKRKNETKRNITTPHALFSALAVGLAFLSCWLPPGGHTRYLAPVYPCLALLIGAAVQRVAEAEHEPARRAGWRRPMTAVAGLMLLAAVAIAASPLLAAWAMPAGRAALYGVAMAGAAVVLWRAAWKGGEAWVRRGVWAVSCGMAVLMIGPVTDIRRHRSSDLTGALNEMEARLPPCPSLVSFEHIDALFAYHLGRPIPSQPWPEAAADVPPDVNYFCFDCPGASRPQLPFAWEEIAAVPMDRARRDPPAKVVVVGRRLDN